MLFSIGTSIFANETSILERIMDENVMRREMTAFPDEEKRDSAGLFYDIRLNDSIEKMKDEYSVILDDEQEKMIVTLQSNVEKAFSKLNEMEDVPSKRNYMDNIIAYWRRGAKTAIYESGNDASRKSFRRYWAFVNVTMHEKGYVDVLGDYQIK